MEVELKGGQQTHFCEPNSQVMTYLYVKIFDYKPTRNANTMTNVTPIGIPTCLNAYGIAMEIHDKVRKSTVRHTAKELHEGKFAELMINKSSRV